MHSVFIFKGEVSKGLSNREIAEKSDVSYMTISKDLKNFNVMVSKLVITGYRTI